MGWPRVAVSTKSVYFPTSKDSAHEAVACGAPFRRMEVGAMGWDFIAVLDSAWQPAVASAAVTVIRPKRHVFSGGEVHVQFPDLPEAGRRALIAHRVNSSDDLVAVLLSADAIRGALPGVTLDLLMPYVPYARQDRRMIPGDPLSIRVLADVINGCGFGEVWVLDPHSDVTTAVIDGCRTLPIHAYVAAALERSGASRVVIPDAGATKRVSGILGAIGGRAANLATIQATKTRDLVDRGRITGMQLAGGGDVAGQVCLIVDDICDGGRTFLELSKLLRGHGAKAVHLYVTHGIFSHGLEPLLECPIDGGRLDGVFTTNSIRSRPRCPGLVEFPI